MAQDFQMQVAEMYRKYEVLIEKVQKYDVLIVDVANLSAKVDGYQDALVTVMSNLNDRFEGIKSLIMESNASIKSLNDKIDANKVEFSNFVRANAQVITDLEANHKGVHHFVEKTHARLSEHTSNSASKDELESVKRSCSDASNSFLSQMRAISARIDGIRNDVDACSSYQKYLEEKSKSADQGIISLSSVLDKQKASLEESIRGLSQAVPLQVENYSKPLLLRFDEMQKLIESIPSTKEIRDELVPKVELLSMDCRNASLKIDNHDQQLKYMDKKLENANLRVSKVELQHQ